MYSLRVIRYTFISNEFFILGIFLSFHCIAFFFFYLLWSLHLSFLWSLPFLLYPPSKWQDTSQLDSGPSFHCLLHICVCFFHLLPKVIHCPFWESDLPGLHHLVSLVLSWNWPMGCTTSTEMWEEREVTSLFLPHSSSFGILSFSNSSTSQLDSQLDINFFFNLPGRRVITISYYW